MRSLLSRRAATMLLAVLTLAAAAAAGARPSVAQETDFVCETGERVVINPRRLAHVARSLQGARPVAILAIGSSSTEGVGASGTDKAYPALLEGLLQRRWGRSPVSVANAGIGGETASRTLERLAERLAAQRFDLVIWQVGTNDAIRGDDEQAFRDMIERGIHMVRQAGSDVVIVDPQFFPTIRNPEVYERFVRAIWDTAEHEGVPVVSRYRLMKAWSARGQEALLSTLAPDRFHMNDRGYACVARTLAVDLSDMARMGAAVAAGR